MFIIKMKIKTNSYISRNTSALVSPDQFFVSIFDFVIHVSNVEVIENDKTFINSQIIKVVENPVVIALGTY
eukprot:UN27756